MALEKQMELFNEGGLLDEGGTVDEESGNDVPVGSLKKEVRDDIPAQLSEGEFVMPADVVRFHGLDKMMALRDEAKMGLARMEAMGQMGNSDEATLPDDVPFGISDLIIVDSDADKDYNVGGFVPNQGATAPGQGFPSIPPFGGNPQQQPYGVVQPPAAPFAPFGQNVYTVPSQFQQPVFAPFQQPYAVPAAAPVTPVYGPGQPTGEPKETFTFGEMQPTVGGTSETREYRNEDGEILYIPFINGEPIYPIPAGYTPYVPEAADPVDTDPAPVVGESREQVLTQEDLRDRDDADRAREQALIEQYGNANARIALSNFLPGGGDVRYGVNIISGMGKLGGLNFLRDEIPDDARIMLKNGDDEIILTGEEYNRLRTNVRRSRVERGRTSESRPSDYATSRPDFAKGRLRGKTEKAITQLASVFEDDDDPKVQTIINQYREDVEDAIEKGNVTESGQIMNPFEMRGARKASVTGTRPTPPPPPPSTTKPTPKPDRRTIQDEDPAEGTGSPGIPTTAQEVNQIISDFDARNQQQEDPSPPSEGTQYSMTEDEVQDYADSFADVDDFSYFQQGGLAAKKKPKAKKKMKRGGLASKK
jgi:hypothetical protein